MNQENNSIASNGLNNNIAGSSPNNNSNIGTNNAENVSSSNVGASSSVVGYNQVNGVINTPLQASSVAPTVAFPPTTPSTFNQSVVAQTKGSGVQVPLQVNVQGVNSSSIPNTTDSSLVMTPGAMPSSGVVLENSAINSASSVSAVNSSTVPVSNTNLNSFDNSSSNTSSAPGLENSYANSDPKREAIEILSLDKKEKVNLLTPAQKENLTKKREEAMREKESYQPVPVSKFKRVVSVLFILILLGIVIFLPEINNYVILFMNKGNTDSGDGIITTGTLQCIQKKVDDRFDINYDYSFSYMDSKLNSLTYVETTVGDSIADSDDLNLRLENCRNLKSIAGGFAGINITCSLSGGTLVREQRFVFGSIDKEKVTSAYVEAGGEYPGEFDDGSSIDSIESHMKAAGYSCERRK